MSRIHHAHFLSDNIIQLLWRNKLLNRQLTNWDYQLRLQYLHLPLQPRRTLLHLIRCRHTIPTRRFLAGKTAADRRHVNRRTKLFLAHPRRIREPTEQRPARRPRKRSPHDWLLIARRLAHQHYLAHHRAATHHRFVHLRTERARPQPLHMLIQQARRQLHILFRNHRYSKIALRLSAKTY
ncbi:MAG: hypothetical protein JWQ71_952 [Pedosphaera sp.]|nr:hypothetical protein [Pedosphaera sp.]